MSIEIRPIQEHDFPALIELFETFANFEKQPEKMQNSLSRMQAEKDYIQGFVASSAEGTILGYATCFYSYHTWTGKALFMDDLYIRESHRNQGIGKALFEAVIQLAKEQNCHKMRWQVSNWNHKAQEFYTQKGARISSGQYNCDLFLDS